MKSESVTIGLVQMSMKASVKKNLDHAVEMVKKAADRGSNIVCLPELFTSRYFAQYERIEAYEKDLVQEIPGLVTKALAEVAREKEIVLIGGSIFERSDGRMYNTSVIFDQKGEIIGKYRKTHIPHDAYYYEQNFFEKGDTGFQTFHTDFGNVGILICYDQWFPEAARVEALQGADIIFYPTAIGRVEGIEQAEGDWLEAWKTVMRGHSIANGVCVAAVNRVGKEDKMEFWGNSFITDAFGKIVAQGGEKEEIVIGNIRLEHGREVKEGWGFFRNRRPDSYEALVRGGKE